MIQKTKGQKQTPASTGDEKVPSRNTRQLLYARSGVFSNALVVVAGDLYNAPATCRDYIFEFLKWFRPDRRSSLDIATRIGTYPDSIRAALENYVAFAFRFRVWLHGTKTDDGRLKIEPVYEEISGPHLDAKSRNGALVPGKNDEDRFVESNHAGEHYEDYRVKLVSKAVGDEIDPSFRLLRLGVDENRDSEVMRILNAFYDPLKLNFIKVQKRISGKQTQNYLMCIIGELSDGRAWRKAGSVRTEMIKRVYGVSTRGRKPNFDQCARDMALVSEYGRNVKASTNASIEQQGQNPAHVSDKEFRRVKERMVRAAKIHKKLTSPHN